MQLLTFVIPRVQPTCSTKKLIEQYVGSWEDASRHMLAPAKKLIEQYVGSTKILTAARVSWPVVNS